MSRSVHGQLRALGDPFSSFLSFRTRITENHISIAALLRLGVMGLGNANR